MEVLRQNTFKTDSAYFHFDQEAKKPLLTSWEPYRTTYAPNEQIKEWFSNGHATNNIAIVTRKISRIIAFDIDGEEANHYFNRIINQ